MAMMAKMMLWVMIGAAIVMESRAQLQYACDPANATLMSYGFCNKALSRDERVKDLISRYTLLDKTMQVVNNAYAIPRLGLPRYEWWQEALHGVASSPGVTFGGDVPGATSFPMPILTAASFNVDLFYSIGQAVSTEARAMHNLGRAGLTFWSPNVNIYRDPRWGRGQETPGEDPVLASKFAVYYVKGLQDSEAGGDSLKVSSCCKHMTAYDVDNWLGVDRYHFNAIVSKQDLEDSYNPPFKSCVEDAKASSVMCSYNRVNGVPTCADYDLLTTTVRNTWGLYGYIVSDCDSVEVFFQDTNYVSSPEDAAAAAVKAGLNLNCGSFLARYAMGAIQQGKLTEAHLDYSLTQLITTQMRLGLYDGDPRTGPYGYLGAKDVCSDKHQELALEAAKQGMVLLKNRANALPFTKGKIGTLAVIGPHAKATRSMIGNYEGIPCRYVSPFDALQSYATAVYSPGCADVACSSDNLIAGAVTAASQADAVVLCVGLDLSQEAEGLDRTSLLLPGQQQQLVYRVMQAAKGPVVLVIFSAGSVDVSFAKRDTRIRGIIWAGYPGQLGGLALAQILFGEHNPGGRLPVTWYPQEYTKTPMTNMNMRPDSASGYPGRTYRFYTGPKLFDFGEGYSYTTTAYKFTSAPETLQLSLASKLVACDGQTNISSCFHLATNDEVTCSALSSKVSLSVHNRGNMAANHAVLLFSVPPDAGQGGKPLKQLVAFTRVTIEAQTVRDVSFSLDPCKHLSNVKSNGERVLHGGQHTLIAGDAKHLLSVVVS